MKKFAIKTIIITSLFTFSNGIFSKPSQNKRVYAYLRAVNFYQNDNIDSAIKLLKVEQTTTPNHPLKNEMNFMLALAYIKKQDWQNTLKNLYKLENMESLNDYILYFKALCHEGLNELKKSLKLYQTLVETYPKSRWQKASFQKAFLNLFKLRQYKKALAFFKRYRLNRQRFYGEDRHLIPDLLFAYAKSNLITRNFREAYSYFKRLLIRHPAHKHAQEASKILRKAKQKLTKRELKILARRQINRSMFGEAKQAVREMKRLKVDAADIALLQAKILMRTQKWKDAIAILLTAIPKNPKKAADPDVYYNLARAYSKLEDYENARLYYQKLAASYPKHRLATHALFTCGRLYSLEKKYVEAMQAYDHFIDKFPKSTSLVSALWEKGWNAFLLNNFDEALSIWEQAENQLEGDSVILSKIMYWKARAYAAKDETEKATSILLNILKTYPMHYYAFQAQNRLIEMDAKNIIPVRKNQEFLYAVINNSKDIKCSSADIAKFKEMLDSDQEHFFLKAQHLIKFGLDTFASYELYRIQETLKSRTALYYLSKFFYCLHDYNHSQYIARVFFEDKIEAPFSSETVEYWKLAYPQAFKNYISRLSEYLHYSPYLVFALMRAESNFKVKVSSSAGAIGLMQVMPTTGHKIAKKMNNAPFKTSDLLDPRTNIAFGTWYFNSLLAKFDGNTILAIPSYNAGPHNVKNWLRQLSPDQVDIFVEMIPFRETRNYVKKVIKNYGVYKTLYSDNKSILRLSKNMNLDSKKLKKSIKGKKKKEDWNQYKDTEDLREKLFSIDQFSIDKLSLIEYFSMSSFKKDIKSRGLLRR